MLPPYRRMKIGGGGVGGFNHSSPHPAPLSQGWRFGIQRTSFKDAKTAETENDVFGDLSYFCTVDRTVKCFNLQPGTIFHDHKIRSVRFILKLCVSCICFVVESTGSVLFFVFMPAQ